MAELQARNLRLQSQLSEGREAGRASSRLETEADGLRERFEALEVENARLNEFVSLHKDDADQRRDQIVVLRDCLSDLKDENRGLRTFVDTLSQELLKIDKKAYARAIGIYQVGAV